MRGEEKRTTITLQVRDLMSMDKKEGQQWRATVSVNKVITMRL